MRNKIINILLIIILFILVLFSVQQCSHYKNEYKNNIEALTDTIEYYKAKNGNLVATIHGYESNLKTLKILNEDLYKQIDNLKIKNKVKDILYINTDIVHELHDTTYTIQYDTIYKGFYHTFNFTDRYRELTGNIKYNNDSLNMNIDKDIVHLDYTIAVDKNNKIYVTSDNPYIRYNEIQGFTIPKKRTKRFGIGPTINYGYDIKNNNQSISIGIGINYNLLSW